MIHANKRKVALAAMLVVTALLVSSCYKSPVDITDSIDNQNAGGGQPPFATFGTTATIAPTPTPTPTLAANNGQNQPNWGTTITDAPTATPDPYQNNNNNNNNNNQNATTAPLPTTPPKTATPQPQQDDSVLKTGSSGDAVEQLQERLKDLGYYTSTVDGSYGKGTAYAVEAFQKANGLYADGIAGQKTQEAVYSHYAIPKSESSNSNNNNNNNSATSTPRRTNTPRPTATPNLSKARYLKVGMSGSDVRQVQGRLIALGYLGGSADGNYGGATEAAVKAFQKKAKVWDDGIAGPDTQTKLYAANAPKASSMAAAVGVSLKEGMNGDEVRALQKRLITLGYLSGSVDGDFGAGTKNAVTAFQKDNGLTADGIAGTETQNKLYASDATTANGSSSGGTPTAAPNISGPAGNAVYTTLKEGDSGEAVRKLQQRLKDLGYYTGTVDGKYGSGTVTAVQSFQTMNKLTVDGVAGPATQQRLYGDSSSANKVPGSLKQFDESSDVRDMQYALYELGYFQDSTNGIYAQSSVDAVREFQMVNGLTVDGVAGKATLDLLFSINAKPVTAVTGEFETLMMGSEGDSVVILQAALYDLGYMQNAATGVFDEETFQALKSFQQYNGLAVDGIAGATTQEKLYGDNAVPNPLRN